MSKEDESENTGKSYEKPTDQELMETLLSCLRTIFLPCEKNSDEVEQRSELLARTCLEFIGNVIDKGLHNEYQPVAFYTLFALPKSGGITHFTLSNKSLGGEPMGMFRLDLLAKVFERAYREWGSEVFGVDLADDVSDFIERWGNVLPNSHD